MEVVVHLGGRVDTRQRREIYAIFTLTKSMSVEDQRKE